MKRRVISLLLAMVLTLALLPGEAWAADPTEDPNTKVIDNVTYTKDGSAWTVTGFTGKGGDIVIPSEIDGGSVTTIASKAFFGSVLNSIVIPGSVTEIGEQAFMSSSVVTVDVSEGLKEIGKQAFYGSNLKTINLPAGLTDIGVYAFGGCKIEEISIPSSVTTIGEDAFQSCKSLAEVYIEEGVTKIPVRAFNDCEKLASIIIPGSVKEVGERAFQSCTSLEYVIVQEDKSTTPSKTKIGTMAFMGCTNLEDVFLAKTVEFDGDDIFLTASKLPAVHFGGDDAADLRNNHLAGKPIHAKAAEELIPGILEQPLCSPTTPNAYDSEKIFCREEDCGYILEIKRLVPKPEHTVVEFEDTPAKEPTCWEEGLTKGKKCSVCGTIIEPQTAIPKLTHTYDEDKKYAPDVPAGETLEEWVILKPSTCLELGVKVHARWCSNANTNNTKGYCSEAEVIPEAHRAEHIKEVEDAIKEATEKNEDLSTLVGTFVTSLDCGHTVEITALSAHVRGPEIIENITKEATCTDTGLEDITSICPVCGKEFTEKDVVIPKKPHDLEVQTTYEPDNICGKVVEITASACKNCDFKEEGTRKIVERPHEWEPVDGKGTAPTCTEPGKGEFQCKRCGEKADDLDLPATGHDWSEWEVTTEATCDTKGEETRTCSVCNEKETREIAEKGHTVPEDAEWTVKEEPTCTKPGVEVTTCTVCNKEVTREIKATGHIPAAPELSDTKIIKKPTCTEEGSQTVDTVCSTCGMNLQGVPIPIPALGHDFGNWTTDSKGVRTRTCSRCGEKQTDSGSAPSVPDQPDKPSTPSDSTYSIRVIRPANGSTSASASSARSGSVITLTFTPNAGYELDIVQVTRTSNSRAVTVSGTGNNRYSFVMPAGNVEVRATFTAIPGYNASAPQATGTGGKKREYTNSPQTAPQAGASAQIYADVPASHWASGEIAWVTRQGYMSGSGNRFNPDGSITTQQLWMVMARIMGQYPATMAQARSWATLNGFAAGGNPNAPATRQQLVTALYRCARLRGSTNDVQANLGLYADSSSVDAVARPAMAWAVANGILSGNNGKLNPTATVSRAQAAVILYRFYQRIF